MHELSRSRDFIEHIQRARSAEAISQALLSVTGRFGLTSLCAGRLSGTPDAPEASLSDLLLCTWPQSWVDRYIERDYIKHDPVAARLLQGTTHVLWCEEEAAKADDRMVAQIFSEARAFNLNDGLALSVPVLDGCTLFISFGGDAVELSPEDIRTVSFAATQALGQALLLHGHDRFAHLNDVEKRCIGWAARGRAVSDIATILGIDEAGAEQALVSARNKLGPGHFLCRDAGASNLSPREKECLQWAAVGKSEWEVSQILGISEHTAEKHLLRAKAKLGAINRAQAVAQAVRRGIIE